MCDGGKKPRQEHISIMHEVLGIIPNTKTNKNEENDLTLWKKFKSQIISQSGSTVRSKMNLSLSLREFVIDCPSLTGKEVSFR